MIAILRAILCEWLTSRERARSSGRKSKKIDHDSEHELALREEENERTIRA